MLDPRRTSCPVRPLLARLLLGVMCATSVVTVTGAQQLTDTPPGALLEAWRDHIRPCDAERAWERIGWHASFAEGLRAANSERRPLLLWMMNGHPLGCT